MRVLGIHFFLISLLLSFAQGSKPSLGFELVGAYYAYKLENQAFGQNNPNHAQNFAQGCKTSRPGKSICSFDEFVRHVMPRVGTRFINGGNWGGPDPENPDVRTVGRDFPRANSNPAWSIDFKDIDMKSMNTEAHAAYTKRAGGSLTTKSNLKDYMDGYKTTLRATRSAVVPAGRINPIDTNPATNADLRKCMQAFDDALIMRKFDSENHIYKNLHGYKWKTSVAGQARQFPMSIEGKPPVPLPDGQGQLEEIDWQRSAQTMNLPHALLGRWRRFHSDLAAGNMDQINKGNSDPNGLAILDTPDPKTGRTYLEGFKSHTRAIGYMQSLIQDIPQAC